MMQKSKIFESWDEDGVQMFYSISKASTESFLKFFPSFPPERIIFSPNGINQDIIHPIKGLSLASVLSEYSTVPYPGSSRKPMKIDGSKYKRLVLHVGKFAHWKRQKALLYAAKSYEKDLAETATLIVGRGSDEVDKELQDLAFEELKLEHTYFIGGQPYRKLPKLFNVASVGVFPSKNEPFGLVFIETMACGTPVIGANSGGPKEFVDSSVGELIPESDDLKELGASLNDAIQRAIKEDWKSKRREACLSLVENNYTCKSQCTNMLKATLGLFNLAKNP